MSGYYLTVGNRLQHEYLRDCDTSHIELAEHEAELTLQSMGYESGVPSYGSMEPMVRLFEKDTDHCVYAAYTKGE